MSRRIPKKFLEWFYLYGCNLGNSCHGYWGVDGKNGERVLLSEPIMMFPGFSKNIEILVYKAYRKG